MFYWSYENFKMVEDKFGIRIKDCQSFMPFGSCKKEHGVFSLENGKHYYVLEGMLGFHIFEVEKPIIEEETLFLGSENGEVKLIDKASLKPIFLKRVMGLPLQFYDDMIPNLIHENEEKKGANHYIVIGQEPDDTDDMACVQEYHDGFRTVWISQETLDDPVYIDEHWFSLGLPDDLESFCRYIDESSEEITEEAKKIPRTYSYAHGVYVDFVYMGVFYRMLPRAFDLHPDIFDCCLEGIKRHLIEMGAPYVKTNAEYKWD